LPSNEGRDRDATGCDKAKFFDYQLLTLQGPPIQKVDQGTGKRAAPLGRDLRESWDQAQTRS
jgi:hypothetical protein